MALGIGIAVLAASAPMWWPAGPEAPRPAAWDSPPPPTPSAPAQPDVEPQDPGRALAVRGLEVLRRWDALRAAAYAEADPAQLRPLYTRTSAAGRRDRALLRRYADQGLVVHGLVAQIRSAEATSPGPRRLRVRVQERYPDIVVRPAGQGAGTQRTGQRLYRDRIVVLRRGAAGWRASAVRSS
jgi:hypothetical protein